MPAGVQIYDDNGDLIIEIGGHVLATKPALLAAVGEIAAEWAHAEAELERCLAALMDTSPDRTFALLKPYKSAGATADGARALAQATLTGTALADFEQLIDRFKAAAEERNKVQHGLWAMRPSSPDKLYRLKAVEYTKFAVRIPHEDDPVATAMAFAEDLKDGYDLARLKGVVSTISRLTIDIIEAGQAQIMNAAVRGRFGKLS